MHSSIALRILLTRSEAASQLGVSLRTIDVLIASGDLQFVKIGRCVRFRPSAFEFFVEAHETRTNPRRRKSHRPL